VTAFIDEVRKELRVEPICRVLTERGVPIAPSTYHAAKARPPSDRATRDLEPVSAGEGLGGATGSAHL
jgi:putative transposase